MVDKANALACLAMIDDKRGHPDLAEKYFRECWAAGTLLGSTRPRRQFLLAWALVKQGKVQGARVELQQALVGFRKQGKKRLGSVASCASFLGLLEWLDGHPTAAQGYLQDAVEVLSLELGPIDLRVADLLSAIGRMQSVRVRTLSQPARQSSSLLLNQRWQDSLCRRHLLAVR